MANDNWGAGDSFATGFFGAVGNALQDKVKRQRDVEQDAVNAQIKGLTDAIGSGKLNQDQIAAAQQQIQKLAGNSKPMKELMQKFGNALHLGHHVVAQQSGGQGGTPGQPPAPAQGGGPTPPPTAMSEQTPIGGSSTQPPGMMPATMTMPGRTPPPGGAQPIPPGTNANPSGAPPTAPMGGPTPPPTYASIMATANPDPEDAKISGIKREMDARRGIATQLGLKPGSPESNEYVATGKWPTSKGLNPKLYTDPSSGKNFMGVPDPDTGQARDVDTGRIVSGATSTTAGANAPKTLYLTGADGVDRPYFSKGMSLFHDDGTPVTDDELKDLRRMHPSLVTKEMTTTSQHLDTATGELYNTTSTRTIKPVNTPSPSADPTPPPSSAAPTKSGGGAKPAATVTRKTSAAAGGSGGGNTPDKMARIQQAHQLKLLTGTTRTMIETAPKVQHLATRVREEVKAQQQQLGPLSGRWNEFMTGKVGAPNPGFAALRTDAGLLQTLLMRMHVGARGGDYMMSHFKELLDTAKQSPENLLSALDEIDAYAKDVANEQVPTVTPAGAPPPNGMPTPPPSSGAAGGVHFTPIQ